MADVTERSRTRVRRIGSLVALLTVVVAGLAVHVLLPDTGATDIAGDALYAVAVYAFLIAIMPGRYPPLVGAVALAWCVGIEVFQLTGIPLAAGTAFPPAMLVLGTVFDPRDLVVYATAILVLTAADTALSRGRAKGT
ncbi:DUF2809 domain-containing protein [Microbacterium schleiferi]|uniref:ribosomal maturation YjgA family protein n=1 Tax=Microbacterium schleiferi TaxID=69362 RepID=UPI00311D78DC